MKLACFVTPHIGGTYSVFKQLRAGLAEYGITVEWVSLDSGNQRSDGIWLDERDSGTFVFPQPGERQQDQARRLIDALQAEGYDGVFVNVLGDPVETNLVRYLPDDILRIMIVHNITPGTYNAAAAIQNAVHGTICVSDRCRTDLVLKYGLSPATTFVVPNSADTIGIASLVRKPRPARALRAIALGRIEDISKGVFWLPQMLSALPFNVSLTVAGDGPDLPELKRRFANMEERVCFLGRVLPKDVPGLLLEHDVMIMPSRFEGFGITLIEAMAAGCVPVASNISGVTSTIIDHGGDGFLFQIGAVQQAIDLIGSLQNEEVWERMSTKARANAAMNYNSQLMAKRYAAIIQGLDRNRPITAPALALNAWELPRGLKPGMRRFIPGPLKNWLRTRLATAGANAAG